MADKPPPLSSAVPIVDDQGRPQPVFLQWIMGQIAYNGALPWGNVTGTPTTIAGYGITDAVSATNTLTLSNKTLDVTNSAPWSILTGTPTTIAGYGITDVVDLTSAQTITGAKTFLGVGVLSVGDNAFTIFENSNPAKTATFNLGALTASRTFYLPDTGGAILSTNSVTTVRNKTLDVSNIVSLKTTKFTLEDATDTTKQGRFSLAGVTSGATRTYTLPDGSGTLTFNTLFGSAANGLAPASGGGTTNFLRADGIWAAPAGGGGGTKPTGQAQYTSPPSTGWALLSGSATPTTNAYDSVAEAWVLENPSSNSTAFAGYPIPVTGADFTYIFKMDVYKPQSDSFASGGPLAYNSTTGKVVTFGPFFSGQLYYHNFSGSGATYSSEANVGAKYNYFVDLAIGSHSLWHKLERISNVLYYSVSLDGLNWLQTGYAVDVTTGWLGGDVTHIGIHAETTSTADYVRCVLKGLDTSQQAMLKV